MTEIISLGLWIKRRRKALDLTQDELARRVGCSLETIRKIEADARRPSREIAGRLASQLGLPSEERAAFIQAARAELGVDRLAPPAQSVARGAFVPAHERPAPGAPEQPQFIRFTNLPAQLTALIGRASEVATGRALLLQPATRLVTLTGPGGVGKTRLGLQVAADLVDDFGDGVYLVDLSPIRDPELVASAIAQTLRVREISGRSLLQGLQDHLQSKEMLLVLDNFEQVIEAAPLIAKLLAAAPLLKVLVTSREILNLRGEHELAVQPLALPDAAHVAATSTLAQYAAIELFIQRAQAIQPNFQLTDANARVVAVICTRLDGLPLAIELAAARIKLFAPEALLARLSSRLVLLTGGPRDLPARQQTIRSTIAWSYDLLSDDEQKLFRRLGVFVGGCTLEAAIEALSVDFNDMSGTASPSKDQHLERNALAQLTALVDKSLLRRREDSSGASRFTMLETVREYALEQLEASGEAELLRQHHGSYYLEFSSELPAEDDEAWARRVNREYDNLRSALEWSQTAGDPETALRLAITLTPLWHERGIRHEAIAALQQTLDHPLGVGRTRAHAHARERLANFLGYTGNYRAAQVQYEQSLNLARELGDAWLTPWILSRLGWLAREQGDSSTAWVLLSEGIAIYRQQENSYGLAWGLTTVAEVAILDENPARAEDLLAESQLVTPFEGTSLWLGWTLNHLGHAAQLRGDYERAASLHHEALAIFRRLGEQNFGLPWAYQSLGETALGLQNTGEGAGWLAQGLALSQKLSDQASIAWCLAGLGSAAALGEEPNRAARLWGAAERLRSSLGCRPAPAARATYERAIAITRAQLGEQAFEAAWDAGGALTLEQAIADVLEANA